MNVLEHDLEYRRDGDTPLLTHIYRPETDGQPLLPLIIDVHGGAWSGGTRFANQRLDREIASRGYVVAAIDFRLAPEHPYPAMIQDVNYAVRWLKQNASQIGALPHGVGAFGTSSGGHMALLTALRPTDERFAALPFEVFDGTISLPDNDVLDGSLDYVIACWPPVDPLVRYRFTRETGRGDLVRNTEGCFGDEATMHAASATRIVAEGEAQHLPPVLVIQGTADNNILMPMIRDFTATYRAAGGDLSLETFEGQPHGFAARPGTESDRALESILTFLARVAPTMVRSL